MNLHVETYLYLHSNNDMYMWNQVNCTKNHYANVGTSSPYKQWSYPMVSCPHHLVSFPSSAIASVVGALSPMPATWSLMEASILLVWWWPRETLLCWIILWLFLQIVYCVKKVSCFAALGVGWPRGPACLPSQVACFLSLL